MKAEPGLWKNSMARGAVSARKRRAERRAGARKVGPIEAALPGILAANKKSDLHDDQLELPSAEQD